jgi:hypothetical protein
MPPNFIPPYFLSWLMNGPASDSPNPMWLPDVAQQSEKKVDILSSRGTEGT